MYNLIEAYRKTVIDDLFKMNSFGNSFPTWLYYMKNQLGINFDSADDIFSIGDKLKEIFSETGSIGRSQSGVSGGGAAWEGLVCWYMNICLAGTRSVVVKSKKKYLPEIISKATSVNYSTFNSTTESDLVAITFPELDYEESYLSDINIDSIYRQIEQIISDDINKVEPHSVHRRGRDHDVADQSSHFGE